ncbi:hypothetical protein CEP54_012153 [Fusarium duplospermum]|uniref:Uncharacterized protein n=1 Tax=Fusarium duplospermum TaxID=1325734 RepID=A0A428PAJ1_9HYPO|nr:hypothetical protein CEP54_012153 [Fusarium duplospermum]
MEEPDVSAAFGTGEPTPYVSPEEAAKRVNPTITPQDRDWRRMHHTFTELHKSDSTLQKILSDHFTHHEARMLLASDRADIKNLQDANTERYNALLQGRFLGVKRDMVSKLTMLYFGLPVEPLTSLLEELVNEFGLNQPDVPMYNIQPPLHFLSAHEARNWGKDHLRGQEAPCWPMPIPTDDTPTYQDRPVPQNTSVPQKEPVMSLRGGNMDDDDDGGDSGDSDDDNAAKGQRTLDDQFPYGADHDYCPPFETSALPKDEWIYLYGHTGCIPFVPRKWRSYTKALRQILHLDHHSPDSDPEDPEGPIDYILVHFDRKIKKSWIIGDELYLTEDSPAMKYLLEHFTGDTTSDHADCCAFFATYAGNHPPHPHHWEPHPEQFETDLTKIGHYVFDTKTGPGKNAISYSYIAFPKTKTATFTIDKFGCNQYNANFRMAIEVLLGKPRAFEAEHRLLRLVDRNKPHTKILPPIVFDAMGQMQWVWELLHPLNNPGADWMVDFMGIKSYSATAVIVPNYYPDPHPHLLSTEVLTGMSPFEDAFDVIQDAVTEAFNEETIARMDSIIVKGTESFEIPANRPYRLEERMQLGKELQGMMDECLMILPVWKAGESKLFPGWPSKPDVYTDFPPLNSRLGTLFKLIDSLCSATNYRRDWRRAKDVILIKSLPPWDSLETPKTESPAFLLTTDTSQAEWLAIRSAITSCDVSVSLLKATEADWWLSIAKANVWGVRPDDFDFRPWFWDVHAWNEFHAHRIKKVDGSQSLPIPRRLKRETQSAAVDLPFARESNVKVDGRNGKVSVAARERKSAFSSRRHFRTTPLFGRSKSPYISPGGLALPVPETQATQTAQAESFSRASRRIFESQSKRPVSRHGPIQQSSARPLPEPPIKPPVQNRPGTPVPPSPTKQQAEQQAKSGVQPPRDASATQSKLQLPSFLSGSSSSRRRLQPQPQRTRERPAWLHTTGNNEPSLFVEDEDQEMSSEDPLQEEPTYSVDQGRLPPDADLWGEDDEPMEDVEENAQEEAEEEAEEEGEPSHQQDRRPHVEFVTDSEYGDDYESDSSVPSDAPVIFPEHNSRSKTTEPIDKDDRARTWAEQPGIFEGWDPKAWPSCNGLGIPITGAPVEKVFRTSDSVPMFTKAVLTPNEQAELQSNFFEVRNIALKRAMQCPFEGCDFSHRLDEPEVIEQHTKLHQSNKCMWCDDPLFEWWSPEQKMAHLRKNHEGKLIRALGMKPRAGDKARTFTDSFASGSRWQRPPSSRQADPPGGLFNTRPRSERQQVFSQFGQQGAPRAPVADMTGGNLFSQSTSRGAIPDRILQLSSELLSLVCGGSVLQPIGVAPDRAVQIISELHGLVGGLNTQRSQTGTTAPPRRAATGSAQTVSRDVVEKVVDEIITKLVSKDFSRTQAGQDKRLFPAMHPSPYDPVEQQKLFDSYKATRRLQPPRKLSYPLPWYDFPGPFHYDDPPLTCPLPKCWANNFEYLRPRQIWDHFVQKHPDHTLDRCPLCHLAFVYTTEDKDGKKVIQQRPEDECIKHFDCHIWQLWDELMPKGSYATYDFRVDLPPPGPHEEDELDREVMALLAARSKSSKGATRPGEAAVPPQGGEKTTRSAVRPQEEHRADTGVQEEQAADTSKENEPCAFFEKCGAIIGSMTDEQYRRHMRLSHPKEVQMVDFDTEDEEETEVEVPSLRAPTPAPTPRPPVEQEPTEAENAQTDESNQPSSATVQSTTPTSKKRKRTMKPRNQGTPQGSEDELSGVASDALSRTSRTRTRDKPAPTEPQPSEETDAYAPASESRSSATQGRGRSPKKVRKERPPRDDDGEYEDDGASTEDEPEEEPEAPKRPRRARSPDWVKKLGPGDPNFEPSDDMYCSKCLRKAPKSGNKSPSRSPLGREKELEYHSDLNRCCRIRNGEGSPENLPNRSGWIRASNLPAKLGQIKSRFTEKYPAYDRTIYPTKASDNNASVWRSDPNNDGNKPYWTIPWPPYEGQPPFPGSWQDPNMPPEEWARKKRRDSWQGRQEDDPLYRYQSDEDSDDDLKPDEDDIAELQEEASNDNSSVVSGLKRRRTGDALNTPVGSGVDTGAEEEEEAGPATKKAKKTPAAKPKPKAKRTRKPRGKPASSQPSRASSRVRQKKPGGAKSKGPASRASRGVSEDASGVEE